MGKVVIIEGRKFTGDKEIAAANADKAAIDRIKAQMDHMSLADLKILSQKLHKGQINFGTKLGEDFMEEVDSYIGSMERREKDSDGKSEVRTTGRKKGDSVKLKENDPEIEKEARKILEKQERTRKLVLFASLFVAAACILYIAIYNITRMRSARTTDLLSDIREQAARDAEHGL